MTATERIELLKAVADCAPEWMGAMYFDDEIYVRDEPKSHYVMIDGATSGDFILTLLGEYDDARAIIAMLDAMEKEGFYVRLFSEPGKHKYLCSWNNGEDGYGRPSRFGATRVEAVSRAFVTVFGGKE